MIEATASARQGGVEGPAISPEELCARYGIPAAEAASFRDIIGVFPQGQVIIREGDTERALYLLRVGRVEISKGQGAARQVMGTIEAVNFFGEMSMINDEPRSASVQAVSESVVVYRIPNPSIHTILTNPLWAELLISRLARNLAACAAQHVVDARELSELRAELTRLKTGN